MELGVGIVAIVLVGWIGFGAGYVMGGAVELGSSRKGREGP